MKHLELVCCLAIGAGCLALPDDLSAATVQTFDPGSAVARVDRSAKFDSLTFPM